MLTFDVDVGNHNLGVLIVLVVVGVMIPKFRCHNSEVGNSSCGLPILRCQVPTSNMSMSKVGSQGFLDDFKEPYLFKSV